MRFAAVAPDPVTGRLVPYHDASGEAVEIVAHDQREANRIAAANRLPAAVIVMPIEWQESKTGRGRLTPPVQPPWCRRGIGHGRRHTNSNQQSND